MYTQNLPNVTVKSLLLDSLIHAAKTCGLDHLAPTQMAVLVAAIADKIEADLKLAPPINPDRRYSIAEIEHYGYGPKKGMFYKAHKHLIRKEGRRSYVLGGDLVRLRETAPTLAASPAPSNAPTRRPRGRPRKHVVDTQAVAAAGEGAIIE